MLWFAVRHGDDPWFSHPVSGWKISDLEGSLDMAVNADETLIIKDVLRGWESSRRSSDQARKGPSRSPPALSGRQHVARRCGSGVTIIRRSGACACFGPVSPMVILTFLSSAPVTQDIQVEIVLLRPPCQNGLCGAPHLLRNTPLGQDVSFSHRIIS